jgi:hypothetical protein
LFSGVGVKALEKHLANKAKRYHLEETKHLPHLDEDIPVVPMTQGLFQGDEKVQAYARYLDNSKWNNNPENSYKVPSVATQLREQWAARDSQAKLFGDATDPLTDSRGKGKRNK